MIYWTMIELLEIVIVILLYSSGHWILATILLLDII